MTRFLLIRHGSHDLLGWKLAGRHAGVGLNTLGHEEASRIASCLRLAAPDLLGGSPLQRARETAAPAGRDLELAYQDWPAFNEIDFGCWEGLTFAALENDPLWSRWNGDREEARCPRGESMSEVQRRFLRGLRELAELHPEATIALFSHGDPIKSVLLHALGKTLNEIHDIAVDPASMSVVEMQDGEAHVLMMNAMYPQLRPRGVVATLGSSAHG